MTLPHFLVALRASPEELPSPRRLRLVERTEAFAEAFADTAPDPDVQTTLRALASDDFNAASDVLESVFRQWYAPLVAFASVFTGNRATAQDIVQDIFIDVWQRRTTLTVSTSFAAYLHGAVRHRAFTRHRDDANRERILGTIAAAEEVSVHDATATEEGTADENERQFRAVIAAADELPPRAREVFYLRWRQGLSYKEIATVMGISPKTVEAQMTIALRRIREAVSG